MGGILVAVFAAGGSYALWNGAAEIPDVAVTSGTIGLAVEAVPALNIDGLVPGSSVHTAFTASNNGDADLSVVMSGTEIAGQTNGLASYLIMTLANVPTPGDCTKDVAGASGPVIGFTSTASPVLIDAGAGTEYCLVVTLDPLAPDTVQGSTATFTLRFDGTQRTP
ncbi:MAG: TasA family protein [Homoserinimonas sp.]